jgi:hypothetical protein
VGFRKGWNRSSWYRRLGSVGASWDQTFLGFCWISWGFFELGRLGIFVQAVGEFLGDR